MKRKLTIWVRSAVVLAFPVNLWAQPNPFTDPASSRPTPEQLGNFALPGRAPAPGVTLGPLSLAGSQARLGQRTDTTRFEASVQTSSLVGRGMSINVARLMDDQWAAGAHVTQGPRRREVMVSGLWSPMPDLHVRLSVGQLRETRDFDFYSGVDSVSLSQNSWLLRLKKTDVADGRWGDWGVQVYGARAREPEVADRLITKEIGSVTEWWVDPRRVSPGALTGARLNWALRPWARGQTISPGQLTPPSTLTTPWADAWITLPQPLARALGSGALSYSVVGGTDVVAQFESPAGGVTPSAPARLKPSKAGTVRVRVVQAADAQYQSAQAEFDVSITKASPQLSWPAWTTSSAVYAPHLVVAVPGASVATGSGPVTYSTSNSQVANRPVFSSSNPSVLEVNATTGQLTPKAAGSVTITASQLAAGGYGAASVSKTVNVWAPVLSLVSAWVAGAEITVLGAPNVTRNVCPYTSHLAVYTFQVSEEGAAPYIEPVAQGGQNRQVSAVGSDRQFTVSFTLDGPADSVSPIGYTLTVRYGTYVETLQVNLQPTTIGCASSV